MEGESSLVQHTSRDTQTMNDPLAGVIDTLCSNLSPALVTPGAVQNLQELARELPPIHRGIFECRLGANTPQVDLSQGILGYDGEPAVLIEHIARMALVSDGEMHPAWSRLQDFCTRWDDTHSPLHGSIRTIWLEFDLVSPSPSAPAPSLFLSLKSDDLTASEARAVVVEALGVLLDEQAFSALRHNVRRCFEAATEGTRVLYVGTMLARQTEAVRIEFHPPTPDRVIPYLEQIGWSGPVGEVENLMAQLVDLVDRIDMVDINVGTRIFPTIGLQCVLDKSPHHEPRWATFLDHLVAQGMCTQRKRDALLAWPGYTNPSSAPLSQLPDQLEVFKRQISHIKIVRHPRRSLEAKAYLWFDRVALDLQPTQEGHP